ncbi:MAG: hypothetical protein IJE91_04215 [Clostridia bacterium]|nr:hypothetical protein [Clostridia bacterium]
MLNFNNYLNVTDTINYKYVKENLITITKSMVNSYFADKPMFEEKNFKYYYYDDFIFDTNNSENNYITLYIEINQPRNVKEIQNKKFAKKDKNVKDLHLTLEEIKNGLFEQCVLNFDNSTLIWQEQYSINLSVNEVVDTQKVNYLIRIIPCFTYVNENKVSGVIYYNNDLNKIEIEYPLVSTKNFKAKNKRTNGLFYFYDIVIKNIFLTERKEKNMYFEIFETLLYNVPDKLFVDESVNTLMSILNFLRNNNIKDYKSIDEQDYAFTSIYKSFSILFAKHALKEIEKHVKKQL